MTITKHYVDIMGGTIDVKSKKGEGTDVTISIPAEWKSETEVATGAKPATGTTAPLEKLVGKRVLVVEDNQINQEIACLMLEDLGVNAEVADNGQIAVDMLEGSEENKFDMIFMDIRMPVLGGIEATKLIRQSKRDDLREIPIVALSANAFESDVKNCLNAGMNMHLAKPYMPSDLEGAMLKYVS